MNLTLIFIVLSIAIAYMLYDTFKKSKQTLPHQNETTASKIKTNYADECKLLKDLHQDQLNSLKHRSISIHLGQEYSLPQDQVTSTYKDKVKTVITSLRKTTKVYLLINQKLPQTPLQTELLKYLPEENIIPYNSVQGAVAILRQLNCNTHLQSQEKLFKIIKQYIGNVWYAWRDEDVGAKYTFANEWEMVSSLVKLIEAYELRIGTKNE